MDPLNTCKYPRFVFRGHAAPVNTIDVYQNALLVSADQEGSIVVWDLSLKRKLTTIQNAHKDSILAIRLFKLDHLVIISQGRDNFIKAWKLVLKGFTAETLLLSTFPVDSLCFTAFSCLISDKHRWLVSLVDSEKNKLCIIDLSSNSINDIGVPTFITLGQWTKYSGLDRTVMMMSVKAFIVKSELYVACGYEDGSLAIIKPDCSSASFQLIDSKLFDQSPILTISFTHLNSNCIKTNTPDSSNLLHSAISDKSTPKPSLIDQKILCALGGTGKNVYIIHIDEDGKFEENTRKILLKNAGINTLQFLNFCDFENPSTSLLPQATPQHIETGIFLALGCWDYRIRIFDISTMQQSIVMLFHNAPISQIFFVEIKSKLENHNSNILLKTDSTLEQSNDNENDSNCGSLLLKYQKLKNSSLGKKQLSPNIQMLACSHDFRLSLWDL
ncbi:hypothetical protein BB561_002224 [Smittium simulii]|uniref:ASTRA-associated protein 1 n=1 Tax=Smittium simulii TaxID=133385 RepID=A0A2T9YRB2_9FUNG|nr:hypothetical protein BB561_002224 [Smittium simulii]